MMRDDEMKTRRPRFDASTSTILTAVKSKHRYYKLHGIPLCAALYYIINTKARVPGILVLQRLSFIFP
jgi:hypothetical protein